MAVKMTIVRQAAKWVYLYVVTTGFWPKLPILERFFLTFPRGRSIISSIAFIVSCGVEVV